MSAPIMRYFDNSHQPPALREVSEPFKALAQHLDATLPVCPETSVALRKLLEAKDCAVRAALPPLA